jgi:hypothetical protein
MTWVAWRLQRTETLVAVAILVLLAALLVPTGIHIASVYDHDGVGACIGKETGSCGEVVSAFTDRFDQLASLLGWLNLVPGVIGVLLAAPLLLDLENGTYRLAWTQSVTRRRYLAGKLGLPIALAVAAAFALSFLMTWWRQPLDHVDGRLDGNSFDFEGIVLPAYVLFALGLALAIGVIWRRAVVALVVGYAGFLIPRLFVDGWARQRFVDPLTATWREGTRGPNLMHAWILSEYPSTRHGDRIEFGLRTLGACGPLKRIAPPPDISGCLGRHGVYRHAVYQPANRFWELQGIETAIFGGVAVVLILFAAWWIHDRVS